MLFMDKQTDQLFESSEEEIKEAQEKIDKILEERYEAERNFINQNAMNAITFADFLKQIGL